MKTDNKAALNRRKFFGLAGTAAIGTAAMAGTLGRVGAAEKTGRGAGAPLKVAVLTGGHLFDVPNFHLLFRSFPEVDAYIQSMVDFAGSPLKVRDSYDVVVFYTMLMDPLQNDDLGPQLKKTKAAIEHLRTSGQGLVILHHAILSHPQWQVWTDITGLPNRKFTFDHDQKLNVKVATKDHAVTQGLKDWEIADETYGMADASAADGNQILLTTDHPKSMKTLCWAREFGKSRVLCLQSGHDNETWKDTNFREVVRRGMMWSARRS